MALINKGAADAIVEDCGGAKLDGPFMELTYIAAWLFVLAVLDWYYNSPHK